MLKVIFGDHEQAGSKRVGSGTLYDSLHNVGWRAAGNRVDRHRQEITSYPSLIVGFEPAELLLDLSPGLYRLTIVLGDSQFENHETQIRSDAFAEPLPVVAAKLGVYTSIFCTASVTQDPLAITFDSPIQNWIVNAVIIEPVTAPEPTRLTINRPPHDRWALPPITPSGPDAIIGRLREQGLTDRWIEPSGMDRTAYRATISGIVDHFATLQSPDGAIIDPIKQVEFQYATPAFAYCTSLLASEGREDLAGPAERALDHSVHALANCTAPNQHEDFFPFFIAHALRLIKRFADADRYRDWLGMLRATDPFELYRVSAGAHDGPGCNWNCKALVGEYLLATMGARADIEFVEASISRQGRFFDNEFGMYSEGPLVYDIFPRSWLADMMESGYDGLSATSLGEALRRGSLTSLLLQHPDGSLPSGGRSAHHLWGDALQSMTFEIAAHRARQRSDPALAGVFKRAARRALLAVVSWRRTSGELSVVRNHAELGTEHGYENYSSHSQYNLLCAAILGRAFEHAATTEDVAERATPAEIGGYAMHLPAPFNRVAGNAGGAAASILLEPYPHQQPAGWNAAIFSAVPAILGINDGFLSYTSHTLPGTPRINAAAGAAWPKNGSWQSLATFKLGELETEVEIGAQQGDLVNIEISYAKAGSELCRERYQLTPRSITMQVGGPICNCPDWRLQWPVLVNDGRDDVAVAIRGNTVFLERDGYRVLHRAHGCTTIHLSDEIYGHRNGLARLATAIPLDHMSAASLEIRLG